MVEKDEIEQLRKIAMLTCTKSSIYMHQIYIRHMNTYGYGNRHRSREWKKVFWNAYAKVHRKANHETAIHLFAFVQLQHFGSIFTC